MLVACRRIVKLRGSDRGTNVQLLLGAQERALLAGPLFFGSVGNDLRFFLRWWMLSSSFEHGDNNMTVRGRVFDCHQRQGELSELAGVRHFTFFL